MLVPSAPLEAHSHAVVCLPAFRTGIFPSIQQFTDEQAQYGADNCGADWNAEAAESAKSYLEHSSFSRQELLEQLMYEGFTQEQAEYGVSAAGY